MQIRVHDDWFEDLVGFKEKSTRHVHAFLLVNGDSLVSRTNGMHFGIGQFEMAQLAGLRARVDSQNVGRTTVTCMAADVRELHADPAFAGALFQVASQFNMLEMLGPDVTPEQGVTRYADDRTQGPACAIAAGAATIYRNYFVPVGGEMGQTATRQLDGLAAIGDVLSQALGRPRSALWTMRNGYALCTPEGLAAITGWLSAQEESTLDALRAHLVIGVQRDVQVTGVSAPPGLRVTQAFCSALPVAYCDMPEDAWAPFAQLVLDAAYEATLLVACEQRVGGGSPIVLLTRLGGGAFGNADAWIDSAILRALRVVRDAGLDVRLVGHSAVSSSMRAIESAWRLPAHR